MTNELYKEAFVRGFLKAANAGMMPPTGAPNPMMPANANPLQPGTQQPAQPQVQPQPQVPAGMQQFLQLMQQYQAPAPAAPAPVKSVYTQQ